MCVCVWRTQSILFTYIIRTCRRPHSVHYYYIICCVVTVYVNISKIPTAKFAIPPIQNWEISHIRPHSLNSAQSRIDFHSPAFCMFLSFSLFISTSAFFIPTPDIGGLPVRARHHIDIGRLRQSPARDAIEKCGTRTGENRQSTHQFGHTRDANQRQ